MLGRREVGVRAERALGREVEHLRPERGGDPLVARHPAGVEAVEERAHGAQRPRVVARGLRVPDADAEQEAAGEVARQLRVLRGDVGRLVLPDVEDPGGDRDLLRRLQVRPRLRERGRAAEPQRVVAERLELGHDAGARLVAAPDAEAAEPGLHGAGEGQGPVLGLEALLDLAERGQRAVERRAVVRGHHARAQQRAAGRHGGVQRDVDEHAGVVERAPQQHGLPVVLDQHGDDRRRLRRADDAVAEPVQAVLEVARVLELAGEQRRPVLRAHDPQRGERGADRGGHGGGGEEERARLDAQVVDDLVRAGDEAAAGGERLRERAHPQVDAVLDPEQLGRPGPARAEHAGAVRLVDHQARAVRLAQLDDLGQRGDVALHREDAVDDHEDRRRRRPSPAGAPSRASRAGCGGTRAAWRARAGSRRGSRRGRRSRRSRCRRGRAACRACPRWPGGRW